MNIENILSLLSEEYGVQPWQSRGDSLTELMRTILSQNTSDVNSGRAFEQLLSTFGSWEALATAEVEKIADAIKCGGLARVKAPRIKLILKEILERRGCLDLAFLDGLPIEETKAWLMALPGVGPKTAGCVLLFSLGKPVLPVDTHVYRVSKRLGLINSKVSPERAHQILEALVPPSQVYLFHVSMVKHGRRICKAQRPLCHLCILGGVCPSYGLFC